MIYVLLAAHFVADFIIQTDKLVRLKKKTKVKGTLIHSLHISIITFVTYLVAYIMTYISNGSYENSILKIFILLILVFFSHFLIDSLKYMWIRNRQDGYQVLIIDQIAHVISLFLITEIIHFDHAIISFNINILLLMISCLIISVYLGDQIITNILTNYEGIEGVHKDNIMKAGSVIGKIERAIMLLLLMFGYDIGIISVFAIKSIIRFKEFKQKDNDYYILGNLLSLAVVVASYMFWVWLANPLINPEKLFVETFSVFIK